MIPSSARRVIVRKRGVAPSSSSLGHRRCGGGTPILRRDFSRRPVVVVAAASTQSSSLLRTCMPAPRRMSYSTERILELRSGKAKADQPKVLYDPTNEKENCGVGLIASLKSVASRDIVVKADEMLVRMAHRGGCGCDPASGDGSGNVSSLSASSAPRYSQFHVSVYLTHSNSIYLRLVVGSCV
jgi:Glutamine amidotransferases class-II